MRRLTFRVLVALFAFALGVAAATLWSLRYFGRAAAPAATQPRLGETESSATAGWRKVSIEGRVTFRVPSDLKPRLLSTTALYRAFRRDGMDVTFLYSRFGATAVCVEHSDEKPGRSKVSATQVAGRTATLMHVEDAVFNLDDVNGPEALKGLTVCVPSVGDGEHELAVLARYKSDRDYQDLMRVIESIKFP